MKVRRLDLEAAHVFGHGCTIMSFIEYDYWVLPFDTKVLTNLLVDQVVVGHEYEVGCLRSFLHIIVRAVLIFDGLVVDFFYVHRIPWHLSLAISPIRIENALIYALLGSPTRRIQSKSFIHINLRVDTEVVTWGNQDGAWLEDRVWALSLYLGQLAMRTTTVDYLGEPDHLSILLIHSTWYPYNLVSLCFEPSESRAEER